MNETFLRSDFCYPVLLYIVMVVHSYPAMTDMANGAVRAILEVIYLSHVVFFFFFKSTSIKEAGSSK